MRQITLRDLGRRDRNIASLFWLLLSREGKMAFWNKKKLIDYDPKSLDLVKLTLVEQSLTAR